MGNYTKQMEDAYWGEKYDLHEQVEYEEIIQFLNSEDFRAYTDGLNYVVGLKFPNDTLTPIERVKQCCKEKEIDIKDIASINTLKSWFNGGERPKKGDNERYKMFALAFALGLNVEETQYLLTKVYLDRAFNFRNYKELIFYYSLGKNYSYQQALLLIKKVSFQDISVDKTIHTATLLDKIEGINEDDELILYINSHFHNFNISNVTAKNTLEELISASKTVAREEMTLPEYIDDIDNKRNIDNISINQLYKFITAQEMNKDFGTSSIFKNAELPKEIKINFPEAATFSKKEPSSDELRKMIIMLFSYEYWCKTQYPHLFNLSLDSKPDYDDYVTQLDVLLTTCGFSQLYAGNPHDWLYCYCAISSNPLDAFRQILCDALWYENIEVADQD